MFSSQNSQVSSASNYIEDVFSTYIYTGNGSTQTITNNIDLSTKGGLVWIKSRTANYHALFDTSRGATTFLKSNAQDANETRASSLTSFNTDGFSLSTWGDTNGSGTNFASWTFRKQPKFFDVVTYTGNGTSQAINHNLGSVPAVILVKRTNNTGNWQMYHRSLGNTKALFLNTVDPADTWTAYWNDTSPTSTQFTVGSSGGGNASGDSYIAYIFAHDAGGFGLTGADNVVSCGSFTKSSGVVASISLGYEPQWLLFKRTDTSENWFMIDNMRNMTMGTDEYLIPNLTNAAGNLDFVTPTATGFEATNNFNNGTYIYIAIRRGPMKVPTSGTSVYGANTWTGGSTTFNTFPPDLATRFTRSTDYSGWKLWGDRLRGETQLNSINTSAEQPDNVITFNNAAGGSVVTFGATTPLVSYFMRRSPSFLDVVCFTTDGSGNYTGNHNLGVTPELIITKRRNATGSWWTYCAYSGTSPLQRWMLLNDVNGASGTGTAWWATSSTSFSALNGLLASSATNVAYLFATCAGVSKVGSYTGTGALQTVNCGFTGGARFVLIKRTDADGDWYIYDSARGISSGNDPYIFVNSGTTAEVTNTNYVDTDSTGFKVTAAAPAGLNASGGTYIFLAIA